MPQRSVTAREQKRAVRDLRRKVLSELGWTVVSDSCLYAPDDPEGFAMYSLAAAARTAGLPTTLEELLPCVEDTSQRQRRRLVGGPRELRVEDRIGEPWRAPTPAKGGEGMRLFEADPAVAERGIQGHIESEVSLADALRGLGIAPLSPNPGDPPFDVGWVHEGRFFVAEVKSITTENEEHQLRLGLGQLLRYRFALESRAIDVRPVLVPEFEPQDPTWHGLCCSIGVTLLSSPQLPSGLQRVLGTP